MDHERQERRLVNVSILGLSKFSYIQTGAPNDRFLSHVFKRCFRLFGVLLKLSRLILGWAKILYMCSFILRGLEYSRIY